MSITQHKWVDFVYEHIVFYKFVQNLWYVRSQELTSYVWISKKQRKNTWLPKTWQIEDHKTVLFVMLIIFKEFLEFWESQEYGSLCREWG